MNRAGDVVVWELDLTCPGCGWDIRAGTATIFPKDPGVHVVTDGYEEHLDVCEDFKVKYRKLMGYDY